MKETGQVRSIRTAAACILLCAIAPLRADIPWLHVDGNQIKDPQGNAVVLRGVSLIDLGFLEGWQGGALKMIDRLTDKNDSQGSSLGWYPKVIRIPVCPPDSVSGWPHRWRSDDDRFYENLLRPVVDYCAAKDLYAILDWHYVADTWDKVAQTSEFWSYMAPRFAHDSHVLFELFNEPINNAGNSTQDWLSVRKDMQTWVDIVRSHAPRNLILVGGPQWCQILAPQAVLPVDGNDIVYVSHIYPAHWLGIYGNGSWFRNQVETCSAVRPVLMTEWGFTTTSETLLNGTIAGYGQPLMDFIEGLGIGNAAWVASYDWGPPMFRRDWTLRCGEGEMGCFVKDTLFLHRNDDQPYAKYRGGTGEPNDPYLLYTAAHLNALADEPNDWDKHFRLMADIDLSGFSYDAAVIAPDVDPCDPAFAGTSFTGVLDGNGHAISNLTIDGGGYLGLFGLMESGATVENLGLRDVNIAGTDYVGAVAGFSRGRIAASSVTGAISGDQRVGGLTGRNWGSITASCSAAAVTGGDNAGGLAAANYGAIADSYSTGPVAANRDVGGLVGENYGVITTSYSTGPVSGATRAGGLVGYSSPDANSTACFWDVETSGLAGSDGGLGKTTAQMQTAGTFLDAGWDFTAETANGTADLWWILEGQSYPRLWWEAQELMMDD